MKDSIKNWYNAKVESYKQKYYSVEPAERTARILQHNGWVNVPYHPAVPLFLKLIDTPGNILDLGCGNGLLLKILRAETSHSLIPYGIDFVDDSIQEAKREVLPAFHNNFVTGNIETTDFFQQTFAYILVCPAYLHPEKAEAFLVRCLDQLQTDGKLILYEYMDQDVLEGFRSIRNITGQFISDSYNRIVYFRRACGDDFSHHSSD
jgi:SAM-dependent methyltransferase